MGACGTKEAVKEREEEDDGKPDFIPVGSVEFPDVKGLRKEYRHQKKMDMEANLKRLMSENGILDEEELRRTYLDEESDTVEEEEVVVEDNAVQAILKKFERGEVAEAAKEKELQTKISFRRDLERAQVEKLIELEKEAMEEMEKMEEAVDEVELVEETVDDDGMETTRSVKIAGIIHQEDEDEEEEEKEDAVVETEQDVTLDRDTKRTSRRRRKDFPDADLAMSSNLRTSLADFTKGSSVPKQSMEEFEAMVEDFILRDGTQVVSQEAIVEEVEAGETSTPSNPTPAPKS